MRSWTFVATTVAVLAIGAQEFAVEAQSAIEPQDAIAGSWVMDVGAFYLYSHAPDRSGGLVGVGSTSWYGDVRDGWIVRVDASGNITTQKRLGGPNADGLSSIARTSDGGWIAGGWTESYGSQHWSGDAWICKLDANLKVQWQKIYRSSNKYLNENVLGIIETNHAGYVALMFGDYPYMMKLDSSGSVLWYKAYTGLPINSVFSYVVDKLVEMTDGGIVVLGGSSVYGGDGYLFKVDSAGNLLWKRWIEGRSTEDESEELYALTQTSDGGLVVGGYTDSYGDIADGWLLKFDADGSRLWEYRYKGSESWQFTDAEELEDGSIVLSGSYDFQDGYTRLLKVSSAGKLVWYKKYGIDYDWVTMSITSDGGFAMNNWRDDDLLKFSAVGDLTTSCKPTKWKLKTYKTTAAISEPEMTVTDQTMKKLNMNAKMYDTTETVTSICQ